MVPPSREADIGTDQALQQETESKSWRCDQPMQNPLPKYDGDPWNEVYGQIAESDRERCKAWKEEVETLLIFAGLFSAVVTAFIVESYKLLKEDSGDMSTALLRRIALQLEGNQTAIHLDETPFSPTSSSVRVNVFWFLSLILSLATVLIGTLCLQWLREHLRLPSKGREALALHHMQSESLDRWYIPQIFTTLTLLLQGGLILFFVGLVDFLWQLDHVVGGVTLAAIGSALIFYVVTTISPAIQDFLLGFPRFYTSKDPRSPCPYRSPQSFLFLQLMAPILDFVERHLPKDQWFWKQYWSQPENSPEVGMRDGQDFSSHPQSETSWILHHKKWLIQRDLDIIFSRHLHHASPFVCFVASDESQISFYDHLMALTTFTRDGTKVEQIAPWHCLEQLLERVIRDWPWGHQRLATFYSFIQIVVTCESEAIAQIDWRDVSDDILRDCIIGALSPTYTLPPGPVQIYCIEKNIRVIHSLLEGSDSLSPNSSRALFTSMTWLGSHVHHISDSNIPYLQGVVNTLLSNAENLFITGQHVNIRNAAHFFYRSGWRIASCLYEYDPAICIRHDLTLQVAARFLRSSDHAKAPLVVMLSIYLLAFMNEVATNNIALLEEEFPTSQEVLLLLHSYREECLSDTSADDFKRSELLSLQTDAIGKGTMISPLFLDNKHSFFKDHLKGMLDSVSDDFDSSIGFSHINQWREYLGSYMPLPSSDRDLPEHQVPVFIYSYSNRQPSVAPVHAMAFDRSNLKVEDIGIRELPNDPQIEPDPVLRQQFNEPDEIVTVSSSGAKRATARSFETLPLGMAQLQDTSRTNYKTPHTDSKEEDAMVGSPSLHAPVDGVQALESVVIARIAEEQLRGKQP